MENRERFRRIFVIVIDSLGVGGAADAAQFGDAGADTLGHIASHVKGFFPAESAEAGNRKPSPAGGDQACRTSHGVLHKAE